MSILDTIEENALIPELSTRAIQMAEFTNSPRYWMDAYEVCNVEVAHTDWPNYCFNMAKGIRRFNERKTENGSS